MADENAESTEDTEQDGEAAEAPSGGKKKLIIIGAAVVILLLVPVGLYFAGIIPPSSSHDSDNKRDSDSAEESDSHEGTIVSSGPVNYELDEFLVNLNTSSSQSRFLKMTIQLELKSAEDKVAIEQYVPRIRDSLQIYLRELRAEDLRGSAATYRLKEELMLRLTKMVYPIQINDILFKDFIIQ